MAEHDTTREELHGLNHPDTEVLLDELLAENERLRVELGLREESQIPVIPRGAQAELERLRNEVSRRDVVLDWIRTNVPQTLELCPYKLGERAVLREECPAVEEREDAR